MDFEELSARGLAGGAAFRATPAAECPHGRSDTSRAQADGSSHLLGGEGGQVATKDEIPDADLTAHVAYVARRQGRVEEAHAPLRRAYRLDPFSYEILFDLAATYAYPDTAPRFQ